MTLTRSGWPRPIVDGWPIPWVSPAENLSAMDDARAAACASGAVCAVCGEGYADDESAFAFVSGTAAPVDIAAINVQPMDNGVLHRRCAQLALSMCPKLKSMHEAGQLQIVAVPINAAVVVIDDGKPKGRIDGADCAIIDRETLKKG